MLSLFGVWFEAFVVHLLEGLGWKDSRFGFLRLLDLGRTELGSMDCPVRSKTSATAHLESSEFCGTT